MAQREMSGKALLDKLYSGLDTMPAVEAERNAQDLRRLNDEFLGKPTELTASGQHTASGSRAAVSARSSSRARSLRLPLVLLSSVAVVGVIAAAALRESDKRIAALPPPPPAVVPAPAPPPPVQVAESPPPEPVVVTNPFDKTEKFTFPPGTSKAEARDQMAAMLLQRAVERGAHRPKARKLAAEPRKPSTTGHGS
jgi:hypothetical protein